MKVSANVFPKIIAAEGAAPATPAANTVVMYAKADGLMYAKDDAGVETALGVGGGGGAVASVNARTGSVVLTAADTPSTINTQTASYTVVIGDAGKWVDMNVASANTLTIPPNSSIAFPVGTEIHVRNMGAGLTTLTPGAGVTIRKPASQTLVLKEQWSVASVKKIATDEWTAFGHLT